MEERVRGVMW